MSTRTVDNPKLVSREEWLAARKKLLAREKQLTHERDAIAAERRQLPWVKVEKNYLFDSACGKKTLADLFDGKSQLIVYHLMFGPEWKEACPSCSFNMNHTDGALHADFGSGRTRASYGDPKRSLLSSSNPARTFISLGVPELRRALSMPGWWKNSDLLFIADRR